MNITLMHNPAAGNRDRPSARDLVERLEDCGHQVNYQSTRERGAKWTLLDPGDLVIAAGGDGTVRKVALALAGRAVPMSILPLGTANNMAKTFGIRGNLPELIRGLARPGRVRMNIGLAHGPWGLRPFVESSGLGLLARTIAELSSGKKKKAGTAPVEDSQKLFRRLLESAPASDLGLSLDGSDLSGRYLLVEALNMRLVGPNLNLAPATDTGDGSFDFALLPESDRNAFLAYLEEAVDTPGTRPPVRIVPGKCLRINWDAAETVHIDDRVWPKKKMSKEEQKREPGGVVFEVAAPSIEILIPECCAPAAEAPQHRRAS